MFGGEREMVQHKKLYLSLSFLSSASFIIASNGLKKGCRSCPAEAGAGEDSSYIYIYIYIIEIFPRHVFAVTFG